MDFKSLTEKAKGLLAKHDDKVDQALDKAGEAAKQKFAGHDEQIDKVVEKAKEHDWDGPGEGGEQPPGENPPR